MLFIRQFYNSCKLLHWKNASVFKDTSRLLVQLDGKTIKTSKGAPLSLPVEKTLLAAMIQREWQLILPLLNKKSPIKKQLELLGGLPLTSLTSHCIDSMDDPAFQQNTRKKLSKDLLAYLDTDTLLVTAPKSDLDGVLRERQLDLYKDPIKKTNQLLTSFTSTNEPIELKSLDTEYGLVPHKQSPSTSESALKLLDSLSIWNLLVFENATRVSKSFICGLMILFNWSNVQQIAYLSNLESICQSERWGSVNEIKDQLNKLEYSLHVSNIVKESN